MNDNQAPTRSELARVGVVAIGRNEGERLERCLRSVPSEVAAVVYVDSGSTDESVAFARGRGVSVVELDMSIPFTAARARNAGHERLREIADVEFVQFVDGDCALAEGFLEAALATMDARPDVVAVAGRRRELFPDASPYNRICDLEWSQAEPGECDTFGGDVLVRTQAVEAVGGYDAGLIAGEDPDFALRLRRQVGRLWQLDADMTWHDADMHELRQWWTRAMRCGYAYAQVSEKHGAGDDAFWRRERRRSLLWGLAVPASVPLLLVPTLGASSLLLLAYPVRAARVARHTEERGRSAADARLWALNCVAASVPEAVGVVKHRLDELRGLQAKIIEYKG